MRSCAQPNAALMSCSADWLGEIEDGGWMVEAPTPTGASTIGLAGHEVGKPQSDVGEDEDQDHDAERDREKR